ncbi:MAG: hypothetical protein LBO06_00815 [Bacteroidales bacterium]|jgi:hypothetical protein|nr:hypothetical protein [Bacteroidales bacterium]
MGSSKIKKTAKKRSITFSPSWTIEQNLLWGILVCLASITISIFVIPILAVDSPTIQTIKKSQDSIIVTLDNIKTNTTEIKAHEDRIAASTTAVDTAFSKPLIILGGGSVKNYIERNYQPILNPKLYSILPAPSEFACVRLKDEDFIKLQTGNIVIMSSGYELHDAFFEKPRENYKFANIVEVFLGYDTLYIKTNVKSIIDKYKERKIDKKDLLKLLKDSKDVVITCTEKGSGTYNEYNKLVGGEIEEKINLSNPYFKAIETSKPTIVLTRSNYDPAKDNSDFVNIYIIDTNYLTSGLYLYIPLNANEKDTTLIMPSMIKGLIRHFKPKFPLKIPRNSAIIIKDTSGK